MATRIRISEEQVLELDEQELEMLSDKLPDKTITTGLDDGSATKLELYYIGEFTYVVPCGEYENAEPWKIEGRTPPYAVRDEYVRTVRASDVE